ncbi:YIP1 family protein [Rubrobacter aplysinae]|uniref:YIP1 family protein n=1 Tax=Rubrobacter aplysinae TaxID=909625 RepID=UPI00064C19EF|nr:YIP1 family protein [Rubrobacter aplysinae]
MDASQRPGGGEPGFEPSRPLESFVETARRVAVEPAAFFRGVTNEDRVLPPMVFAIICGVVSAALGIAVEFLAPVDLGPFGGEAFGPPEAVSGQFGGLALAGIALAFVVLAPLFIVLGLYIGSFIYQILVRIVVGRDNAGYWATFKIYAYTSVVSLLSWLPVVGFLATLYGYYLVFVAVREAHDTTPARAAIVAAIPLLFFAASLASGFLAAGA